MKKDKKLLRNEMLILFVFFIGMFFLKEPLYAIESRGVTYPESIRLEGKQLNLRGIGLLRWKYFFKVYQVAFYLPAETKSEEALKNLPKRLDYYFFVDMEAKDFQTTAMPLMVRNVGKKKADAVQEELEKFNAFYRDVSKGQRYTITYEPGRGTSLALQGEELGVVKGAEFAAAYFSIWLGPDPVSKELQEGLFNNSKSQLSLK